MRARAIARALVADTPNTPCFLLAEDLPLPEQLAAGELPSAWQPLETSTEEEMIVLAPLEIVSARGRDASLSGFEYVWEVYKPSEQRRWGCTNGARTAPASVGGCLALLPRSGVPIAVASLSCVQRLGGDGHLAHPMRVRQGAWSSVPTGQRSTRAWKCGAPREGEPERHRRPALESTAHAVRAAPSGSRGSGPGDALRISRRQPGRCQYTLPMLDQGKLVARTDLKVEQTTNTLVVKGFWLESHTAITDQFVATLARAYMGFMRFINAHALDAIALSPGELGEGIEKRLSMPE
jgi:hypothetical protein